MIGLLDGRKPVLHLFEAVFYAYDKFRLLLGLFFTYTRRNIAHKKIPEKFYI